MNLNVPLLCFSLAILCSSCKELEVVDSIVKPTPQKPTAKYRSLQVGQGQGDLIIDGFEFDVQCNDTIKIAAGSYNSITIKNILTPEGCSTIITNKGIVELKGDFKEMKLENLRSVTITGNGDPAVKYGFQFSDNVYRCILISKYYTKSTIQYASFKNIRDYGINYNFSTEYDESPTSVVEDIKFLHLSGENTARLFDFAGGVENNKIIGYIKGLEIAYLDYKNSDDVGAIAFVGNAEDYNIHHNRINNINKLNNQHNGIFHIRGNGQFHDNYISNHQGNALRAWIYTIGKEPKDVLIYNNIVVNSRKYSAFETQSFDYFYGPKVTYANAKVYNNTCGSLNMSKDWYGSVVDVYNLHGGTCSVTNNIGFDFPAPNPGHNIYSQQSATPPETAGNLYFETKSAVGFDDESRFTLLKSSTAKNAGQTIPLLDLDYHGQKRHPVKPSIGAVE